MPYQRVDLLQCLAGLAHQPDALENLGAGIVDERLDFLCGIGGALGKFAHFLRHHGKALAGFARTRRFHAGVQRQKVRLEGNLIDYANDLADFTRCRLDALHGVDGPFNDFG